MKPESTIIDQVFKNKPYSCLGEDEQQSLISTSSIVKFEPGQIILRPDEFSKYVYLVLTGKTRLLVKNIVDDDVKTLTTRGSGQLLGWVSLLRASPCEWVIASEETTAVKFNSESFVKILRSSFSFRESFSEITNIQESYTVLSEFESTRVVHKKDWANQLIHLSRQCRACTFKSGQPISLPHNLSDFQILISTDGIPGYPVGSVVKSGDIISTPTSFPFDIRCVLVNKSLDLTANSTIVSKSPTSIDYEEDNAGASLQSLGILEYDSLDQDQQYPTITGRSAIDRALAVCEMISLSRKVPFRRDILEKVLEDQERKNKDISLESLAKLCEILGFTCQIAQVKTSHINRLELPCIIFINEIPAVLFEVGPKNIKISNSKLGAQSIQLEDLPSIFGDYLKFVIPRRSASTPTVRFGWNWFTPLLQKYKRSLALVFVASLLAQLFGLAIPLLIQQIIDKVLSQGNLSSLNVLGTVMVVLALFQGVLTVLRTFIFVDTTDRMDLSLGSSVIDRLLSLPLSFFEKRPVGELSQRLGELNNIRSFLTGTALVSVLNIVFSLLYLVVMVIYSPLLTAVSLSTLPLYFLIIFVVAPIYRNLLRKRAAAQAQTQSHLIEVLGGIQTVKAQHFEVTARWKWQDRYRQFVDQGFRSTALGATTGEVGNFLNQLSSLLVLWVGMFLVLEGQLTLGMLIAFRIISGKVTAPLLQLSGLYQGFQKVQISMERLSDIVDQNPEFSNKEDIEQISLPPIRGSIRFENVSFGFSDKGPRQVSNVSLEIDEGSFVGIVGQSGSGKSTLMKLLPRLYNVDEGRIFLDNYDVSKVNLSSLRRQIGIVPQDSLLFEGTVAQNICLNDPEATTESMIEVSKLACAHEFIMGLPSGYATPIAERGSNLSGGQRQRIAIARTLLSNPQLLIMDEATSALDYNTEKQVCTNLQSWADGRTVLFITHRLSSIRNSTKILVMEQGSLVESGTHNELISLNQRYSTLYQQQDQS